MTVLRRREFELQVGTARIVGTSGLRCVFKATKTLKPEPNTLELTVYNLSPERRAELTAAKTPTVVLSAGYENETTQIFLGQAVHVKHERSGPDVLTHVSTSDGGDKFQKARVQISIGAGAKTGDVLRAIVKALGLKPGNSERVAQQINLGKAASLYLEGVCLNGQASYELTNLCRSAGLEWSIQDGALQFVDVGKPASLLATVLTEDLLIGTPSISSKGIVEGSTFLQRDFLPGRQIQIRHEFVQGAYRLEKCTYRGDTKADDWAVEFEAKGPPP